MIKQNYLENKKLCNWYISEVVKCLPERFGWYRGSNITLKKLERYICQMNMEQIHKFPVATMSKEKLLERLQTVDRWKNVFEIQQNQVRLRNFSDVENIIDLFTERYTKSEVTGQEYDTSVKDKAEPIGEQSIVI